MAEASRSKVTITLGRSGQVVKKAGPVLDNSFPDSFPAVGIKRSVRDRLGSNVDAIQLDNKRPRGDSARLNSNCVDDVCLGKDDLRFKIMRKNILSRTQGNGQQNSVDLRDMLSRPSRPSTTSLRTQQYMPERKNSTLLMPEPTDSRQHMAEPRSVRQQIPKPNNASIVARVPSMRTADSSPHMEPLRTSYSPWTLDHIRRRSPDRFLNPSSAFSPPRNEELHRKPMIQKYNDVRTMPYVNKDIFEVSRPMSSMSFMTKPALPLGPPKPVAPLLPPPPPPGGTLRQSLYSVKVDEQPTIDSFLHSLGLNKYAIHFKAEEIDMATLRQMGDSDLKELGIPMGPRKKILLSLMSRSKRQA